MHDAPTGVEVYSASPHQLAAGSITPQMFDWLSGIKIKDLMGTNFVLSPGTFLLLLEGQADFSFFETLSLPSLETMNQAPPDVIDRLNAIKEVDLTYKKVGFTVAGEPTIECSEMLPQGNKSWNPSRNVLP